MYDHQARQYCMLSRYQSIAGRTKQTTLEWLSITLTMEYTDRLQANSINKNAKPCFENQRASLALTCPHYITSDKIHRQDHSDISELTLSGR